MRAPGRQALPEGLAETLQAAASAHLPGTRVTGVALSEERDSEGEGVLGLRIVHADDTPPEAAAAAALTRHLLGVLADAGETRFAMVSFVAVSDADTEAPA
ncbi:MAG: hypothetical protein AAGI34_17705 [Pseudomonadota bacterium]